MDFNTIVAIGLPIVTGIVGYLIKRYGANKMIGDLANQIDDGAGRIVAVQDAVTDAFKPDAEGKVELTGPEVKEIYNAVDVALEGFGIELPDWPGQ